MNNVYISYKSFRDAFNKLSDEEKAYQAFEMFYQVINTLPREVALCRLSILEQQNVVAMTTLYNHIRWSMLRFRNLNMQKTVTTDQALYSLDDFEKWLQDICGDIFDIPGIRSDMPDEAPSILPHGFDIDPENGEVEDFLSSIEVPLLRELTDMTSDEWVQSTNRAAILSELIDISDSDKNIIVKSLTPQRKAE
jgi:hypothetical protein